MTKIEAIIKGLQSSSTSMEASYAARAAIADPATAAQDRSRLQAALDDMTPPDSWLGGSAKPMPPIFLNDD